MRKRSAWRAPLALALAHGGENLYDGWMKDSKSDMIFCNNGFRLCPSSLKR